MKQSGRLWRLKAWHSRAIFIRTNFKLIFTVRGSFALISKFCYINKVGSGFSHSKHCLSPWAAISTYYQVDTTTSAIFGNKKIKMHSTIKLSKHKTVLKTTKYLVIINECLKIFLIFKINTIISGSRKQFSSNHLQ